MSEGGGDAGAAAAASPEGPQAAPVEAGAPGEAGVSGLSDTAAAQFNEAAIGGDQDGSDKPEPVRGSLVSGDDFLPGAGEGAGHAQDPKEDVRANRLEQWQKSDLQRLGAISGPWNDSVIKAYRARSAEQQRLAGG